MSDIVLNTGKEVTFDLSKLTRKDYKGFFDRTVTDEEDDKKFARVSGMTVDEIESLEYPEYRRFIAAFYKKCREPLADPNSQGASS